MKSLQKVLDKAWAGGFKTKSNFAREHADSVAACASLGYITTHIRGFQYGNTWRITKEGLEALRELH